MDLLEKPSIVIELGDAFLRVGFAGEAGPRYTSAMKKWLPTLTPSRCSTKDAESLKLVDILHRAFNDIFLRRLLVVPSERKVVVLDAPDTPRALRSALAMALLGRLAVPEIGFLSAHMMSAVVTELRTCLILDSGFHNTRLFLICDGYPLTHAYSVRPAAAVSVRNRLRELIEQLGVFVEPIDPKEAASASNLPVIPTTRTVPASSKAAMWNVDAILDDIVVKACHVADLSDVSSLASTQASHAAGKPVWNYELKNSDMAGTTAGTLLMGADIVCGACESLFVLDEDDQSIVTAFLESLLKCTTDSRKSLTRSIRLTGGMTMIPGFARRLVQQILHEIRTQSRFEELRHLNVDDFKFVVPLFPANMLNWLGGSIYVAAYSSSIAMSTDAKHLPEWMNVIE